MDAIRTVNLRRGAAAELRRDIKAYFNRTYTLYEDLFECLSGDEAFFARPEVLRHPLTFYYGHTAAFYINKLNEGGLTKERINPEWEQMLAIGVDEMSWDDLDQSHYDWPSVPELRAYRAQVRDMVNRFIDELPLSMPVTWNDPFWIIMMGIEHERIHLETSSVLIRQLELEFVRAHPNWPTCPHDDPDTPPARFVPVEARTVQLGKPHPSPYYGWDNEYGNESVPVAPFAAQDRLVTNGDFLAFIADGGYQQQDLWTDEGWAWCQYRKAEHPVFWVRSDDEPGYACRQMTEVTPFRHSWPVELNQLEADAYAAWVSKKTGVRHYLPTEAQWRAMYDLVFDLDYPNYPVGIGNIGLEQWASSSPATRFRHGPFFDLIGNVWQWSSSYIDPFEGFVVHPAYQDFTTPTYDTQHNLIKGGSWITTGNEQLHDSRYAFRRHFFQHAGLRLVRDM